MGVPPIPQRAETVRAAQPQTLDEFGFAYQPGLGARKIKSRHPGTRSPGPTLDCSIRPGVGKLCSPSRPASWSVDLIHHPRGPGPPAACRSSHRTVQPATPSFLRLSLWSIRFCDLPFDRAEASVVFQLVSRRHEGDSVIITPTGG